LVSSLCVKVISNSRADPNSVTVAESGSKKASGGPNAAASEATHNAVVHGADRGELTPRLVAAA